MIFYVVFWDKVCLRCVPECVCVRGGGGICTRDSEYRCYYCSSTGTVDAVVKMIRHEGLSSFYKGMSTKIVQSVLAASILFMIKEELVKAFTALAHW